MTWKRNISIFVHASITIKWSSSASRGDFVWSPHGVYTTYTAMLNLKASLSNDSTCSVPMQQKSSKNVCSAHLIIIIFETGYFIFLPSIVLLHPNSTVCSNVTMSLNWTKRAIEFFAGQRLLKTIVNNNNYYLFAEHTCTKKEIKIFRIQTVISK